MMFNRRYIYEKGSRHLEFLISKLLTNMSVLILSDLSIYINKNYIFLRQDMSRTLNKPGVSKPTPATQRAPATQSWKDKLHPQEYQHLKSVFDLFDEDHSGFIDPEEINKIMLELGQVRKTTFNYGLIESLKSKNKPINFDEFLELICPKVGDLKTKEGLRTIFNHIDKLQDGGLDFEELKELAFLTGDRATNDDLLQMLHTIHVNNKTESNESLGFQEFYTIVSKFYKK